MFETNLLQKVYDTREINLILLLKVFLEYKESLEMILYI